MSKVKAAFRNGGKKQAHITQLSFLSANQYFLNMVKTGFGLVQANKVNTTAQCTCIDGPLAIKLGR